MSSLQTSLIVHITTRAAWQEARQAGQYTHPSLATDGYIHCSRPSEEQLLAVANAHFVGEPDLVVLVTDRQHLTTPVEDEEFEDSGLFFPHVYGPINTAAVVGVLEFPPGVDGCFHWPAPLLSADGAALWPPRKTRRNPPFPPAAARPARTLSP